MQPIIIAMFLVTWWVGDPEAIKWFYKADGMTMPPSLTRGIFTISLE